MGGNIQAMLGNLQASFGFELIGNALDGGASMSASSMGWGIVASLAPGGAKLLLRGLIEERTVKGFIRYSKNNPRTKEIDAARFLSNKNGSRIYIRGNGLEGADFLMDGVKWELKTLDAPTNNAVFNNIKKSIKRRQSDKIIVDGRSAGLTYEEGMEGIRRAARNGYTPSRVILILKDGSIKEIS